MSSLNAFIAALLAFTATAWALPHSILQAQGDSDAAAAPPRLVAYIQTFKDVNGGPLSLLPLLNEDTGVTHVLLSAVHLNEEHGDITLNDHHPNDTMYDTMWSEVKQLQDGGIKVMMMLGGAAGGTYQRLSGDDESFQAYYQPLLAILRQYNIQGLDLDIEESVPMTTPLRLLRQLNSDLGSEFLLTMAPVASALLPNGAGLHGFSQREMDDQASDSARPNGKLVNWYNAQFYNGWGDASSTDNYDEVVGEGGWAADRVVMGVLTNPGDGGSGFVQLDPLKSVLNSLRSKHSSFGCAVGWEYWAAGTADGMEYPWMWVKAVGDVINGKAQVEEANATAPSNGTNSSSSGENSSNNDNNNQGGASSKPPRKDPPTPWPTQMQQLESAGAGHWDCVKALNSTDGQVKQAGDLLGVTDLLNEILGETLGSLPLI